MTKKKFDKKKILDSVTKVVDPKPKAKCRVINMGFWCVGCTQKYTIHRKDEKGELELPQQICPHMILREYTLEN
jgi:hypothetical protein